MSGRRRLGLLLGGVLLAGCTALPGPTPPVVPAPASATASPPDGSAAPPSSPPSPSAPPDGPGATGPSPSATAPAAEPAGALPGLVGVSGVVLGASDDPDAATLTWRADDPALRCVRTAGPSSRTVRGTLALDAPRVVRAQLRGLASATSYRIGDCGGRWSDPVPLTRLDAAADTLLFFGDPQLTTSASAWSQTLAAATAAHPDAALLLLAGDLADDPDDADQWALATSPAALRRHPVLSLRGNHDVGAAEFDARFGGSGAAGVSGSGSGSGTGLPEAAGGDRFQLRGDMLLIVLDTYAGDLATHERTVRRALAAHPDAPWRVVAFHQAPFSGGGHLEDADIAELRADLAPVLARSGVDLVLNGHDHHYARSLLVAGSTPVAGSSASTLSPAKGQVLYVTAGSASGSWYFPLAAARPWTAVVAQPFSPSYVAVEADAATLRVTAATASGRLIDQVTLRH